MKSNYVPKFAESRPRPEGFCILKHSTLPPGLWPWTSAHAPSSCAHSHVNRQSFRLRISVPQRYCLFRDSPAARLIRLAQSPKSADPRFPSRPPFP